MKKLVVSILLLAVFATQYANSVSLRRRREAAAGDDEDTGVVDIIKNGMDMAKRLPLIGDPIKSGATLMSRMYLDAEYFTGGAVLRFLGGTLPCEISKENGIQCAGITDETDIASLIMGIAAESPLPKFGLSMMKDMLDGTLNPMMDTIFGGVLSSGSR